MHEFDFRLHAALTSKVCGLLTHVQAASARAYSVLIHLVFLAAFVFELWLCWMGTMSPSLSTDSDQRVARKETRAC